MDNIDKHSRWIPIIMIISAILIAYIINACKHKPKAQPSLKEAQIKLTNDSLEKIKRSIPNTYTPTQRDSAAKSYQSIYKD